MNYLDEYIEFLLNYDYRSINDSYKVSCLRLGVQFFDRVRTGLTKNLVYRGQSLVDEFNKVQFKSLNEVDDPIEYLFQLVKVITDKDHPLLTLMYFGADYIKTNIHYKFKKFG